jgi:hypothetical protein
MIRVYTGSFMDIIRTLPKREKEREREKTNRGNLGKEHEEKEYQKNVRSMDN